MSSEVDAIVLAGGLGRRLGDRDKGLLDYRGRPLIAHVLERLAGQCASAIISCNRNLEKYQAFGLPLARDAYSDFQGPLAGVFAAAQLSSQAYLFVCPCDTPDIPENLVEKLLAALKDSDADIAVPHDGQRRQNLHMLLKRSCVASIAEYLRSGARRVDGWQSQWQVVELPFSEKADVWKNLNTPEQFRT